MNKHIVAKESYGWCPNCGHILVWLDIVGDNFQHCFCPFCEKEWIAIFKEKEG